MQNETQNSKVTPPQVEKLPEEPEIKNTSFKKWKKKFAKDFTKKEYIPIKGLFFLIYGANVSLIPFLTLQARSLGINEEEVGIIYSCIPIAALLAPALSGMLADKIGNFRILLSILTAGAGLTSLLFIIVPVGRVTHQLPDNLPIVVTCSEDGNSLRVKEPYICEMPELGSNFSLQILNCELNCRSGRKSFDEIENPVYNLTCGNSESCFKEEFYNEYIILDDQNSSQVNRDKKMTIFPAIYSNGTIMDIQGNVSISLRQSENDTTTIFNFNSIEGICPVINQTANNMNCSTVCDALTQREKLCNNTESVEELNSSFTFYLHLVIRLLKEFTLATSMPLLDGAAVTILQKHQGDFGFQRMYCNVGMMVMTPISGTLIDYFSSENGFEDFRPAIYMYCALKLFAAILILFLKLEIKESSNKVIAEFSSLMIRPEIIFFLIATFLAGTCYGYIETFLFWLLEDLGADKQLMGITVTVGSIFGIPLLMVSTYIITNLGHVNTIVLCFMVYIIRLLGYTFIPSPWWAMPFEALECFTVSLMVVTFVSYAAVLATPGTIVTLQGMHGGLYNGVGRGAGSLIGGYLIESIGIFMTFRMIAIIAASAGTMYFFVNLLLKCSKKKKKVVPIENVKTITEKTNVKDIGQVECIEMKMKEG